VLRTRRRQNVGRWRRRSINKDSSAKTSTASTRAKSCKLFDSSKVQMIEEEADMYRVKIEQLMSKRNQSRLTQQKSLPDFDGNSGQSVDYDL